ncbi:hypothetical protein F7725_014352, partial [Dissostichus mawsoni]
REKISVAAVGGFVHRLSLKHRPVFLRSYNNFDFDVTRSFARPDWSRRDQTDSSLQRAPETKCGWLIQHQGQLLPASQAYVNSTGQVWHDNYCSKPEAG